mmetsp:Transcript_104154/g.222541  ORF Transcript_104154/g.222541 Transcript_104154/m.222541 type:complete len:227 (-) Transcript_104154:350-1030(-)
MSQDLDRDLHGPGVALTAIARHCSGCKWRARNGLDEDLHRPGCAALTAGWRNALTRRGQCELRLASRQGRPRELKRWHNRPAHSLGGRHWGQQTSANRRRCLPGDTRASCWRPVLWEGRCRVCALRGHTHCSEMLRFRQVLLLRKWHAKSGAQSCRWRCETAMAGRLNRRGNEDDASIRGPHWYGRRSSTRSAPPVPGSNAQGHRRRLNPWRLGRHRKMWGQRSLR